MSFQDQENNEPKTDQLTFKVGEREFNAESAATKIVNADNHINTIESENQQYKDQIAALEAKLAQSTKLDEALAKIQQSTQESQVEPVTPGISEEHIGEIATKRMEEYLAKQRAEQAQAAAQELANGTFKQTGEQLASIYGDKVDDAVKAKAEELKIEPASLYDMAKSPATANVLLELMKVSSSNQATPSGSLNTHGHHNQAPEKFVDYSKSITSGTVMDALAKAGATY